MPIFSKVECLVFTLIATVLNVHVIV